MMRPLDGITVVSIEQAIAAPYCTRLLGDLGARVIKIERPDVGDFARHYDTRVHGLASHFVWCNRSKESITLDLKKTRAVDAVKELLKTADVFVQNLAPGAAERMGLGNAALQALNPKLIICDISGYGSGGSCSQRKAYDLLIQAESGFLTITGPESEPSKAGLSIADISAGVTSANAILSALLLRGRTGEGTTIDVSMLESMTEWMGYPLYYAYNDAPPPPRSGAGHATIYPYGPYSTANGVVLFGLQNDREWRAFATTVLLRPDLAADHRFTGNHGRNAHRHIIEPVIVETLGALSVDEAIARLDAANIGTARVNEMRDVWAHRQLEERGRWGEVGTPGGTVRALIPISGKAWKPAMGPVPALGQHTVAVLTELGLSGADIADISLIKGE
ncbi:CaiB/BaiF CoA-transferase family protein [Aminobacter sp. MSH1]|uniref:CaiB/BaiF CoA transferase family protein n=1 Tax=Aminobacter sp. MSH1 TaxID=374606 RepID=UPI000D3A0C3E|nr:CaiB/BaiF CoA-transferase family protein [Aminobacter sp. MSH1]